jgi:hypothetical protein
MAHPGSAALPLYAAPPSPPSLRWPWLGYAVILGYLGLDAIRFAYAVAHGETHTPLVVWLGIDILVCVVPLLVPGVRWTRRAVALAFFAMVVSAGLLATDPHIVGAGQILYAAMPTLYAAGWIALRHSSLRAYAALAVAPLMTAIFWPYGPLALVAHNVGYWYFLPTITTYIHLFPAVAAILVAGALAQGAAATGLSAAPRWPYWMAVAAVIAAMVGVMFFMIPTGLPIVAIVLGHVASRRLRGTRVGGRGLAITAYVLGYAHLIISAWLIIQAVANFRIEY